MEETRLARSGRRASRDEKGGFDSSNEMLSGGSWSELVRNGGKRRRRSKSGSGSCESCLVRLVVDLGSRGAADEMACARRCCFAELRRCASSSWGAGQQRVLVMLGGKETWGGGISTSLAHGVSLFCSSTLVVLGRSVGV